MNNLNSVVGEIIRSSDKMLRVIVTLEDSFKGKPVIKFQILWNSLTELPKLFLGNPITQNSSSISIPFENFTSLNIALNKLSKIFDTQAFSGLVFMFR